MPRKSRDGAFSPTPYEDFRYLLAEMERVVGQGKIQWPADQVDVILIRLVGVVLDVARALDQDKVIN